MKYLISWKHDIYYMTMIHDELKDGPIENFINSEFYKVEELKDEQN